MNTPKPGHVRRPERVECPLPVAPVGTRPMFVPPNPDLTGRRRDGTTAAKSPLIRRKKLARRRAQLAKVSRRAGR